jgi:transketolase
MADKPTRDGFGEGLLELGKTHPNVVALSGDLEDSARAIWFKQKYPERFISVGIAEQDLVGTAAGLSLAGKIPFACSFSTFISGKSWEQIRIAVCYQNANVKLVGSHGGLSVGADGATAEALEEFTILRALPNMTVLVPCDAVEAKKATFAAATHAGPVYLRLGRNAVPIITQPNDPFTIGQIHTMREGEDVTLIAAGIMVKPALDAAATLEQDGIDCRVLNMASLKPLDEEAVLAAAAETGAIVTAEDHLVHGGLGSLVAQLVAASRPVPMAFVGMEDRYGTSGRWDQLLEQFGLTPQRIAEAAKETLARKSA